MTALSFTLSAPSCCCIIVRSAALTARRTASAVVGPPPAGGGAERSGGGSGASRRGRDSSRGGNGRGPAVHPPASGARGGRSGGGGDDSSRRAVTAVRQFAHSRERAQSDFGVCAGDSHVNRLTFGTLSGAAHCAHVRFADPGHSMARIWARRCRCLTTSGASRIIDHRASRISREELTHNNWELGQ